MSLSNLSYGLTNSISRIKGFIAGRAGFFTTPLGAAIGGAIAGAAATGAGFAIARKIKKHRRKKSKKYYAKKKGRAYRRRKTKSRRGSYHGHRRGKKRIVRGRGLGYGEIHHGHRGGKIVSFTTKDGKRVRFKVKGSQKEHLGRRRRR